MKLFQLDFHQKFSLRINWTLNLNFSFFNHVKTNNWKTVTKVKFLLCSTNRNLVVNHWTANLIKSSNTQTIRRQQPTNCFSVFDHFVVLALKGLKITKIIENSLTLVFSENLFIKFKFKFNLNFIKINSTVFSR